MGGERIELLNLGPAHSPGDIMVWLPGKDVIITGDMAFHVRLLPVFEHTDTAGWLETWDKFAAMNVKHIIPGHGGPTNMAEVTKYTRDYLRFMREQIGKLIEDGGDLQGAYEIDQSAYEHLDTYEFLARQNAGRIFRSMEFE
jgi:glyoxylase-like metal-dependent hydrolase (beta-lactamase superfamily II)